MLKIMISIIILNYRTAKETIRLINEISNCNDSIEYSFIVIDNSCSEIEKNTLTKGLSVFSNLEIIYSKENRGYSSGNNIGLKSAFLNGSKYFLILNPDIKIKSKNFLESLVDSINKKNHNNLIFIGPAVFNPYYNIYQGPFQKPSAYKDLFISNSIAIDKPSYVYSIIGCCIFGRLDLFEKIGFFDEDFFLYCEEYVVAEKAINSGYKILYDPSIKIEHLHKSSYDGFLIEFKKKLIQSISYTKFFSKYKNFNKLNIAILYLLLLSRSVLVIFIKYARSLVR